MLVEAGVKRLLRAEEYTVKGGTNEGYFGPVNVMANTTVSGVKLGVAGSIMVASVNWEDVANSVLTAHCQEEHTIAQKLEDMLGTRMVLINSAIAQARDEESLAEFLVHLQTERSVNPHKRLLISLTRSNEERVKHHCRGIFKCDNLLNLSRI